MEKKLFSCLGYTLCLAKKTHVDQEFCSCLQAAMFALKNSLSQSGEQSFTNLTQGIIYSHDHLTVQRMSAPCHETLPKKTWGLVLSFLPNWMT